MLLVGVRDLDPAEEEYVAASGVKALDARATADRLIRRIEAAGFRHTYVHLDLDVLDPRDFDEVICPVPGGVRYDRLLEMLRALTERLTVVGSSLLEFVPGAVSDRVVEGLEQIGVHALVELEVKLRDGGLVGPLAGLAEEHQEGPGLKTAVTRDVRREAGRPAGTATAERPPRPRAPGR